MSLHQSSSPHPSLIQLPPTNTPTSSSGVPLRSVLKSRPGTPQSSPPATSSPPSRPTTISGAPSPFVPRGIMTTREGSGSPAGVTPTVSGAALHSPTPLAPGYAPRVAFDTFENPQARLFSYTLRVRSDGWTQTRTARVFLCATSPDTAGNEALDWVLDSLVQDGDELVVFRGIDVELLDKDHDACRDEARDLLRQIQEKCAEYDPDRKLSIVLEFIAGKVTETIDRLIALYRPDAVVVGTRGQKPNLITAWGTAFGSSSVGSVSKYCLSHSPVPIIVVRPENKVRKSMAKRRADPKRGSHFEDSLGKTKSNVNSSVSGGSLGKEGGSGIAMKWTKSR